MIHSGFGTSEVGPTTTTPLIYQRPAKHVFLTVRPQDSLNNAYHTYDGAARAQAGPVGPAVFEGKAKTNSTTTHTFSAGSVYSVCEKVKPNCRLLGCRDIHLRTMSTCRRACPRPTRLTRTCAHMACSYMYCIH